MKTIRATLMLNSPLKVEICVSYGPRAKMIPPGPERVRKSPLPIGLTRNKVLIALLKFFLFSIFDLPYQYNLFLQIKYQKVYIQFAEFILRIKYNFFKFTDQYIIIDKIYS